MTTLKVNAIEPEGATTNLAVGMTGQNVVVGGSGGIKVNTMKDAGGNTLWTSNGSGTVSSVNSAFGSAMILLSTQTASGSASISFTSGIDSTYKEYIFEFYDVNPATDNVAFTFNTSTDGGSNYNTTKTTTYTESWHNESDASAAFGYIVASDLAQSTSYQHLTYGSGSDADQSCVGELHLFNPASTTFVKDFYATSQNSYFSDGSTHNYIAGYCNTTSAVDAIDFKMSSGNFDGKIKMYGVK